MAFERDADTTHPPDFALLRNGGLAMYRDPAVLHEAEQELRQLGYEGIRLDAYRWSESDLHEAFVSALNFPVSYGRNLNALADCLYDVAHGDYGWSTTSAGLAVTIDGYGAFAEREPDLATSVGDVLAGATSTALLFGHRLIWLLQVDNGRARLGPVGGFQVPWNGREWLDAKRR